MNDKGQEKYRERQVELLSALSHELRTPLSTLHGLTELMLGGKLPRPKELALLQVVHDETFRLTRLVSDLLDLARLESRQEPISTERIDLAAELKSAARRFSKAGGTHSVELRGDEPLPWIWVEVARLRQVLDELLANAARFSPGGGRITLEAEAQGKEVVLQVGDHGLGIPAAASEAIFERFYRIDSPEHRKVNGVGLGLALAKQIVEAHEGRIWAESRLGGGSTFFLALPLRR